MSVSSDWDAATPRRGEIDGPSLDPVQSAFDLGLEQQLCSLSIRKPKKQVEYFNI